MRWVFVNNQFFESDKATLLTNDLAIQRGYAAFDYFRTSANKPLFLDDYLDRFFNSAHEMFISIPLNRDQIKSAIMQLIEMNNLPESGVRLIVTGGYAPDSYMPVQGNFIINQEPIRFFLEEDFISGAKVITYEYLRDLPTVKSINYLMGIWLQHQLKEKHLNDVLYFNNGVITEFPRANVFIVTKDKELITPAQHILAGITRKRILEFAPNIIPTFTRNICIDELSNASEVFMTSTTKRILPVVEIDGKKIGDGKAGPITTQLYKRFIELEKQYIHS